jgi:tetratricopeptide (TPR) repeat protein
MNAKEYSEQGDRYFSERNFDGAIADFSEVIKLEPDNPFAYYKRGLSYTQKNELDLAITDFTEAIRLEPNKIGDFYFDRGLAYISQGNNAVAISDLEMAVKIDPQKKEYREVLGELKGGKTHSTAGVSSSSGFLDDLIAWDPEYNPGGQIKRRNIAFFIVLGIGLIIGAIVSQGSLEQWIAGLIVGAIFGAIYGFGIVNLLRFVIKEWRNIKDDFAFFADLKDLQDNGGNGIFDRIKYFLGKLLIVLLKTLIWRPIKVICYAAYLSPFIGIYQGIRLLIERGRLKR